MIAINISRLLGEVEFWRTSFLMLGLAWLLILLLPPLSEWLARTLHSHAIAASAFYKVLTAGVRAYRRVFGRVMEETAE